MPTDRATVTERAWALADQIMSISYGYAVKMHESIAAGKGAQGWNEFKHAAEIRVAVGDVLESCCAEAVREERERRVRAEQERDDLRRALVGRL